MILSIQSSGDVAYGTTPSVKFRLTVENKSDTYRRLEKDYFM